MTYSTEEERIAKRKQCEQQRYLKYKQSERYKLDIQKQKERYKTDPEFKELIKARAKIHNKKRQEYIRQLELQNKNLEWQTAVAYDELAELCQTDKLLNLSASN